MNTPLKHSHPGKTRWTLLLISLTAFFPTLTSHAEIVPLGELPIVEAVNHVNREARGYEHPRHGHQQQLWTNQMADGSALQAANAQFEHGYHISRPRIFWTYDLGGQYLSLTSQVGTQAGRREGRTTSLEVYGDDKLLHRTGPLDRGKVKSILVDVRGVNTLKLQVVDLNGAKQEDAILGEPLLTKAPRVNTPPEGVAGDEEGNAPPKPVITLEPEEGRAPLTVEFNSEQSTDADGTIMRYTWHFGDGETEFRDFNTSHTYQLPGIYEIGLVAEDNDKGRGVTRKQITVGTEENTPPRAQFTASQWLAEPGEKITLDAGKSRDRDGSIEKFQWTFPDGSTLEGETIEKSFDEMGLHVIDLTVTDNEGGTHTTSRRVRVDDGSNSTIFPLRDGARILTIGNSLLGGLKSILETFAAAEDPPITLEFGGAGKGAGKVDQYVEWPQLRVREKIMDGYDIVLIQPWGRQMQDDWETAYKPYAKTLVEWVRESGAYPVFYMPHLHYINQPEGQMKSHERIGSYAKELGAGYIPAGLGWAQVARDFPKQDEERRGPDPERDYGWLYSDGVHQNMTGQLLTAMSIWHYLTGKNPLEMSWPEDFGRLQDRIDQDRVPYLRETAAKFSVPAEPLREKPE
jgi:chitodextrinase